MQIAEIDFCGREDLDELCAIEAACFEVPWERRVIENDLSDPGEAIYMKATFKDTIAGYCVLSRHKDVSHLMNLAVRPDFRRMGVASQLMLGMNEVSAEWQCRRMKLEVRSSNRDARDFYSSLGFSYVTRLKGYYSGVEDALVLVARLPIVID